MLTPIDVTAAFQWDFVVEPGKDFVFNGAGVEVVAVPEPSMVGMKSFLGGMVFLRRSRRRG